MIGRMSPGIAVRLVFLCLVGAASSARLSAPMSGLACESDIEGETMELGHRQLDVTAPSTLRFLSALTSASRSKAALPST